MNERDDLGSPDGDEFFRLANDWLEDDLSEEDLDKLRELVRSKSEFRRAFQEIIHLDTTARELLAGGAPEKLSPENFDSNESLTPNVLQWKRRGWIGAAAASIAAIGGIALWKQSQVGAGGQQVVLLDPRWSMQAAEGAVFQILSPGHVKLISGELTFSSFEDAELLVETPFAKALAHGTKFLIGHHEPTESKESKNIKTMKRHTFTRMLVLAGTVTLTNGHGTAQAGENEAVIAEADKAPEKLAVEANSSFAFECYTRLAKENEGGNIFFSPYSISNALLMTAEGARGKTALEMGNVLGLPSGLRRVGEVGQQIPWEMGVIHTGHSRLNRIFNESTPEQAKLRKEKIALSRKLEEVRAKMQKAAEETECPFEDSDSAFMDEETRIVDELNAVRKQIDGVTLRVANAIWGDHSKVFKEAWQKTVEDSYGTGAIQKADFINNHEAERKRINAWAEKQTEGRIQNLIPEKGVNEFTRLVLTNAIYFKGEWAIPFKKRATSLEKFTLANGGQTDVPLMKKLDGKGAKYASFNGDGTFFETPFKIPAQGTKPDTYPGKDGFSLVELPYQGGETSMVIIAPNDPSKLSAIEAMLSPGNVTTWLTALRKRQTRIFMPKFQLGTSYRMKDTLSALGMPSAFIESKADFSGISEKNDIGSYIGDVIHQAFIAVNEEGTEAAAATAVIMEDSAMIRDMVPFTPTFRADRPFIYLIRDQKNGTIIFLGRMTNPNQ